jgi:alcohol dehydrogenase
VDTFTTPRLLKLIADGRLDATPFATHHFPLEETMAAYDVFADAANTNALKVVLEAAPVAGDQRPRERALVGHGA